MQFMFYQTFQTNKQKSGYQLTFYMLLSGQHCREIAGDRKRDFLSKTLVGPHFDK